MTHREAMLLLIDKTSRITEAAKVLKSLDAGSPLAVSRAEKLIRVSINEKSDLSEADRAKLRELIPEQKSDEGETRSETIRFRCTPNERAALELLAQKYADGNLSKLIMDALQSKYPTL